jgi:two-component system OmpR family sensor kinase
VCLELVRERSVLDGVELGVIALAVGMVVAFRRRDRHPSVGADSRAHEGIVAATSLELRTPITIARGHAEMLRDPDCDSSGEDHLDIIVDELDRLTRLTERLNILISADDPSVIVRSPVTIESVVVDIARRWCTVDGRDWRIECTDETCIVVDAARVTIALDAMIDSALERTVEGDRIVVSAYAEHGWAVFAVTDTGRALCGSDDEISDSASLRDDDPRMNLELRVAGAVCRAHGGRFLLDSRSGSGNELALRLPIGEPVASHRP